MDRFLSTQTKKIDAKGRVSVPAVFRAVLARRGIEDLYGLQDFVFPAFSLGGPDLLDRYERQIATMDPFSQEAHALSLVIHGAGSFFRLDAEGRLSISDAIRDAAGITDQVAFVGRSDHFQIWDPERFETAQRDARERRIWAGAPAARNGETG